MPLWLAEHFPESQVDVVELEAGLGGWVRWGILYTCILYVYLHTTSKYTTKIWYNLKVNDSKEEIIPECVPYSMKFIHIYTAPQEIPTFSPAGGNSNMWKIFTPGEMIQFWTFAYVSNGLVASTTTNANRFLSEKKVGKIHSWEIPNLNSLRLVLVGWLQATVIRAASEKLGFPIHLPGLVPVVGSCEGVRAS